MTPFFLSLPLCSGRTFPTHQYFSAQLGAGQLSLYNILKAYSLLDTEVHCPAVIQAIVKKRKASIVIICYTYNNICPLGGGW